MGAGFSKTDEVLSEIIPSNGYNYKYIQKNARMKCPGKCATKTIQETSTVFCEENTNPLVLLISSYAHFGIPCSLLVVLLDS